MKKQTITELAKQFGEYSYKKDDFEFWFARDLQKLLGYVEWRKFIGVIKKARESCEHSNQKIENHFVNVAKKVNLGSGAQREIDDIMLTRYACYLIAQNGDPRKEEIAFAQSYFAIQTRKQELIEERIALKERLDAREKLNKSETELSKIIYEKGVDGKGFARIRSKGDWALFGGNNTAQMKKKLQIPQIRPLADFLPTVTIAAKNFATELTNFNVKKDNLQTEHTITDEHIKHNTRIRKVLLEEDITPENLAPEKDIKKIK
ncbi:MAG: DNA damage-inducible protein D, partial [Tenericutes bacterium]|nr:DNA damage-inducible protein D [Mycoplasmatota bacterium]